MQKKSLCLGMALVPMGVATAIAQQAQRPNIMLIVVDDMGYSDLQCFGGEVQSPNLNSLAEDGSRFTQFFNCGRSCPSRASLLTGCYPHEVGITGMGLSLTRNCVTVAEALKNAGYHTGMSGKWHLSRTQGIGNNHDQMLWLSHQGFFDRPFSDINTYPCNRGFDEHWGTIWGVSDHFDPFSLVHNESPVFTDGIPEGFYYADFVADKAIDMLNGYAQDDEPFFMYVAFQEPHWPVQAKQSDIDKYKGVYDDGWDALRERRYNKMVEMGLIDPAQTPNAPNMSNRPWNNESNKAWQSANMEVHAAMVDCVDQNIGRIIAELKAKGMYDNTLIVFSSDNGASSENYNIGDFDRHNMTRNGEMVVHNAAVPGGQLTYNYLANGWAGAVNTPFRYWKTQSFHGGVAAPTIIKWPESMGAEKNTIVNEPCNFIDFMPTCLEVAGADYPATYNGHTIQPIAEEARSLVPMAKAGAKWDTERIMFWEHENGKAVRTADWRLTMHTNGNGGWQLFDMHNDYSETTDVAAQHPDVVADLKRKWNAWAIEVGLIQESIIINPDKVYSISNKMDNNLYIQDNNGNPLPMGPFNENSYWQFEPTGKENCYYIKNVTTGRYAQACSTTAEQPVNMGTIPVEYKVVDCSANEGTNCFGITSTNLSNTDFTPGCIGWNWRGDNVVQTYAAAEGTNHRSFWKLTEVVYNSQDNKWALDGKTYTIRNFSNIPAYMQDNDDPDNQIQCGGEANDNSYWFFEKTDNDNCYYIKNATTNRYIQGYEPVSQLPVLLGDEQAEYYVIAPSAEGGRYGFSFTGNSPFDFTAGTIGLNLRAESNQDGCIAQTYAAANGTNHRSFWTLQEIDASILSITNTKLPYNNLIYDLQGRRLNSMNTKGIYIVNGRRILKY